jgi:hypothetical protein
MLFRAFHLKQRIGVDDEGSNSFHIKPLCFVSYKRRNVQI